MTRGLVSFAPHLSRDVAYGWATAGAAMAERLRTIWPRAQHCLSIAKQALQPTFDCLNCLQFVVAGNAAYFCRADVEVEDRHPVFAIHPCHGCIDFSSLAVPAEELSMNDWFARYDWMPCEGIIHTIQSSEVEMFDRVRGSLLARQYRANAIGGNAIAHGLRTTPVAPPKG